MVISQALFEIRKITYLLEKENSKSELTKIRENLNSMEQHLCDLENNNHAVYNSLICESFKYIGNINEELNKLSAAVEGIRKINCLLDEADKWKGVELKK